MKHADLAQLVELEFCKLAVVGSIPTVGSKIQRFPLLGGEEATQVIVNHPISHVRIMP